MSQKLLSNIIPASGGTLKMNVSVLPANASDKSVSWTISNPTMASNSAHGLLTAKQNGED